MNITIDGRPLAFEGRPTILEVAKAHGILIPSLCEHPALEPYGACRLCLVEVQGRRGYVPACTTRAEEGLEVRTDTPELRKLRRGILELILAEHPHACLICEEKSSCDDYKSTIRKTGEPTGCVLCPANGRCELQRAVEAVGLERVPYPALRREGEARRDDPFIDRDNSLCILCGRCVRICSEVRGASVLTFVSRGSETVIGTAMDRRLLDSGCRFCGACVDVCPTGSLFDRSARYERLPETETEALCPFCAQGCRLRIGVCDNRIVSVAPDPEGPVNRGQACVKGRFVVKAAVAHRRRLLKPQVRREGRLEDASWDEALAAAAEGLGKAGPGGIAVTASAQSSCEDLYALHLFAAEVLEARPVTGPWEGTVAAALRSAGRRAGQPVPVNFVMSDIGRAGVIVNLGEDLPATQPIVGLEVTRAVRSGATLIDVGAGAPAGAAAGAAFKINLSAGRAKAFIKAVAAAVRKEGGAEVRLGGPKTLGPLGLTRETLTAMARALRTKKPVLYLAGPVFVESMGGPAALAELAGLAALTEGRIVPLGREANGRGALEIAGAFDAGPPSRRKARAHYLAGPSPKLEPGAAGFVVFQGSYEDENAASADVVLPETTAFEAEGHFVNVEGRIQSGGPAVEPAGQARPGWRILADLAAKMGRAEAVPSSVHDLRKDLARRVPSFAALSDGPAPREGLFLEEGTAWPGAVIGPGAADRKAPRAAGPRDPDDYKGLDLALENKSLKLVRGR